MIHPTQDKKFFGKHMVRHYIQEGRYRREFLIDIRWPDERKRAEYESQRQRLEKDIEKFEKVLDKHIRL